MDAVYVVYVATYLYIYFINKIKKGRHILIPCVVIPHLQ